MNGEFEKTGYELITRVIHRGKNARAFSLRNIDVKRLKLKNKQVVKIFVYLRTEDVKGKRI